MGKIGILTFHEADNYGAILQAYALCKTINKRTSAEIINYHNSFIIKQVKKINQGGIIKKLIAILFKTRKHKAFERFVKKHIRISRDYDTNTIKECNQEYDKVFIGSDQVWNLECTDSDRNFFGEFANQNTRLFSYAASFGSGPFPGRDFDNLLMKFDTISLREAEYIDELKKISNKVRVDIDPTMLLKDREWEELANYNPNPKKKYVFVYMVGEQIELLSCAKQYANEHGFEIITNKKSPQFFLHCSPEDFLCWIRYADCVFTNSFHGTVFSILFHKRFAVECKIVNGYNNRAFDLLNKTGLTRVLLENWDESMIIEWGNVDKIVKQLKDESLYFISDCLN